MRTTSLNDSGAKAKEHFSIFSEAAILSNIENVPLRPFYYEIFSDSSVAVTRGVL